MVKLTGSFDRPHFRTRDYYSSEIRKHTERSQIPYIGNSWRQKNYEIYTLIACVS